MVFETFFASARTIYMMSLGWLTHPEEYERYYLAWKLTRERPEWVESVLLEQQSDQINA